MSNFVEEDDKSSYEDLVQIADDNFEELSRKEDAILSDGDDADNDDDEEEEQEEKEETDEEKEAAIEEINEEEEEQDISDTIQNVNPELLKKYNLDYMKFQHKLYSAIFGIKTLQFLENKITLRIYKKSIHAIH